MRHKDARKWRISASPYILIYRVLDNRIQILRIRHGRENWTFE
ncbi:type II toxin-antitoxin system RelE/ParE family toxin [Sphingomonas sp. PAMC 26621]|nr:type II toxin-antitoxin system RelE/ParE family toxin [Sphingomonas sp. PAMC 26621]